jgi:hypothetical protein
MLPESTPLLQRVSIPRASRPLFGVSFWHTQGFGERRKASPTYHLKDTEPLGVVRNLNDELFAHEVELRALKDAGHVMQQSPVNEVFRAIDGAT